MARKKKAVRRKKVSPRAKVDSKAGPISAFYVSVDEAITAFMNALGIIEGAIERVDQLGDGGDFDEPYGDLTPKEEIEARRKDAVLDTIAHRLDCIMDADGFDDATYKADDARDALDALRPFALAEKPTPKRKATAKKKTTARKSK